MPRWPTARRGKCVHETVQKATTVDKAQVTKREAPPRASPQSCSGPSDPAHAGISGMYVDHVLRKLVRKKKSALVRISLLGYVVSAPVFGAFFGN